MIITSPRFDASLENGNLHTHIVGRYAKVRGTMRSVRIRAYSSARARASATTRTLLFGDSVSEIAEINRVKDSLMKCFCRWYCNRNQREEPIEESSGHYVVRDGSLIIQNVEENDGGSYMCVASNSEGSETLEIRLTVSAPLSVHVQPTIQTVDLGKSAYLVITRHRHRSTDRERYPVQPYNIICA